MAFPCGFAGELDDAFGKLQEFDTTSRDIAFGRP
jgi:hypothetical protein